MKVFPVSIIFKFNDLNFDLRINTTQSFEISQLINEYRNIKDIVEEIDKMK